MRLTDFTDYSLRVLIYLALTGERLATISELARAYNISANHLMKIIHQLGKLGYIETVRGRRGGMRLSGKPAEINLGRLVRQVEPDFAIVECFVPARQHNCVIGPSCALQRILGDAMSGFLGVLDSHTLADLLTDEAGLRSALKIQPT